MKFFTNYSELSASYFAPFVVATKWDALLTMPALMLGGKGFTGEAVAEFAYAVTSREKSMSTALERGLALPHAAVAVDRLYVGWFVLAEPMDFESIDSLPTRVICCMLIPRSQKLLHIRAMSDIARGLDTHINEVASCRSSDDLKRTIVRVFVPESGT